MNPSSEMSKLISEQETKDKQFQIQSEFSKEFNIDMQFDCPDFNFSQQNVNLVQQTQNLVSNDQESLNVDEQNDQERVDADEQQESSMIWNQIEVSQESEQSQESEEENSESVFNVVDLFPKQIKIKEQSSQIQKVVQALINQMLPACSDTLKQSFQNIDSLEKIVHVQKLIQSYNHHTLTLQLTEASLLQKINSLKESKIRSQCNKNIATFFARILMDMIYIKTKIKKNKKGRQKLREKYTSINNMYIERPNKQKTSYRFHCTIKKLQDLMAQIQDDQWNSAFTQAKIYQKVRYSEVEDSMLKKYYYCVIPRLQKLRKMKKNGKTVYKIWKHNFYQKTNLQIAKQAKVIQQRSFTTAKMLQEKWKTNYNQNNSSEV